MPATRQIALGQVDEVHSQKYNDLIDLYKVFFKTILGKNVIETKYPSNTEILNLPITFQRLDLDS